MAPEELEVGLVFIFAPGKSPNLFYWACPAWVHGDKRAELIQSMEMGVVLWPANPS